MLYKSDQNTLCPRLIQVCTFHIVGVSHSVAEIGFIFYFGVVHLNPLCLIMHIYVQIDNL